MAFCSSCGKEIPTGAGFCPTCGAATSEANAVTKETKSEYGRFLKVLLVLVTLVVSAWFLFVLEVPCAVQLPFGFEVRGSTTIWGMLTGQSCRVG